MLKLTHILEKAGTQGSEHIGQEKVLKELFIFSHGTIKISRDFPSLALFSL